MTCCASAEFVVHRLGDAWDSRSECSEGAAFRVTDEGCSESSPEIKQAFVQTSLLTSDRQELC